MEELIFFPLCSCLFAALFRTYFIFTFLRIFILPLKLILRHEEDYLKCIKLLFAKNKLPL
jgi:hypothetical protein